MAYATNTWGIGSKRDIDTSQTLLTNRVILFIILHIPLGLVLDIGPSILPTTYGLAVIGLGVFCAIAPTPPISVTCIAGYIVGAEVLWRMTDVSLFWEIGKYSIILILLLNILRNRQARFSILPTLYFLFLLPAIIPTMSQLGFLEARGQISFYLSGPLAITVCSWFFAQYQLSKKDFFYTGMSLTAPVVSMLAILAYDIISQPNIQFGLSANFLTSGGFGPNQVSTILGLVIVICFLLILVEQTKRNTIFQVMIILWCTFHGLLTFARAGMFVAAISIIILLIYAIVALPKNSSFFKIALFILGISVFTLTVISPFLDNFTGGAFNQRFTSLDTSGRDRLLQAELDLFWENPILGTGIGLASEYRQNSIGIDGRVGAHTEYSRALAEHGLLGFLAYLILGVSLINLWLRASRENRQIILVFALWGVMTLLHSSIRIVAAPFMISFCYGVLEIELDAI